MGWFNQPAPSYHPLLLTSCLLVGQGQKAAKGCGAQVKSSWRSGGKAFDEASLFFLEQNHETIFHHLPSSWLEVEKCWEFYLKCKLDGSIFHFHDKRKARFWWSWSDPYRTFSQIGETSRGSETAMFVSPCTRFAFSVFSIIWFKLQYLFSKYVMMWGWFLIRTAPTKDDELHHGIGVSDRGQRGGESHRRATVEWKLEVDR